ncbi:MAG: hypothetical protein H6Q90_1549 [Deltaproteobacteria bacterium]|nr:hypothetical protein [Deltaproteobacteria bacterium]
MRRVVLASLVFGSVISRSARAAPPVAAPAPSTPQLVALIPADDARASIALGPRGEVYEPDGKGAWMRKQQITTADKLAIAGRAGGMVVANGEGVVYRLAANGWSALRLAQKGLAIMSGGSRAIAAVGRQLYALDHTIAGEPAKLALAGAPVLAIGAGKGIVIATERGLLRVDGAKLTPIAGAPRKVARLVSDLWAVVDGGALDLRSNKTTPWPVGLTILLTASSADDSLVGVARAHGKLELVTLRGGKLDREPISLTPVGDPVGIVVDRKGRAVVALRDGRLVSRAKAGNWEVTTVSDALPTPRPGPPPALSQ